MPRQERRLDSFGVSGAVVAGIQVLAPHLLASRQVTLMLSEGHSWLRVEGDKRLEVTWHAKGGGSDKRRRSSISSSSSRTAASSAAAEEEQHPDNWLYLKGHAVPCEGLSGTAVALLASLNPAINANSDSLPLALLQRRLLALCRARGWLARQPLALATLADVTELAARGGRRANRKRVARLYVESIASAVTHFADHHIYPYLCLAGFAFRSGRWSEALFQWREAARVLSRYNFNPKEDEEAYKELQEIASDLMPHALSQLSANQRLTPHEYADVVAFYDGLCAWEEESKWPVLHVGWSKYLVSSLNRFPGDVRARVRLLSSDPESAAAAAPASSERSGERIASLVAGCSRDPDFLATTSCAAAAAAAEEEEAPAAPAAAEDQEVRLHVRSAKMRELRDLLVKREGKLNSSAIQLQITAQSSLFSTHAHHAHHGHHVRESAAGGKARAAAVAAAAAAARASPSATTTTTTTLLLGSPLGSSLSSPVSGTGSGGSSSRTPSPGGKRARTHAHQQSTANVDSQ